MENVGLIVIAIIIVRVGEAIIRYFVRWIRSRYSQLKFEINERGEIHLSLIPHPKHPSKDKQLPM
jgi:hypothetical protein